METKKEKMRSKLTKTRNEFRNIASLVTDSTGSGYLKVIDDICGMYEEYIIELIKEGSGRHHVKS